MIERMASVIAASFWVIAFSLLLKIFGVVRRSMQAINISKTALSDFQDKTMGDDEKESAFRSYAKSLYVHFFFIATGSIAAFALPGILLWLLAKSPYLSFDALIITASSWQFIFFATLFVSVLLVIYARR